MKGVIAEEVARRCRSAFGDRLRALVLTGSLARDEGTFVKDDSGCQLLGDAEFLLLLEGRAALPTRGALGALARQAEDSVQRCGLGAKISLTAGRLDYLRKLPPSIFAYELRHCGQTLVGPRETLSLIPDFPRGDIPREDAWRLLANRLVELLEGVDEILEAQPVLSPALHYRTVKLYLDMATSLLVFVGGYAPTYAERAATLRTLLASPRPARLPFDFARFAADVIRCTDWKLGAAEAGDDVSRAFWARAVDYAHALWRWELAHLVECHDPVSNETLMDLRRRGQPFGERLRGWAHVVRQGGWRDGPSQWPRWARGALRTSPRYAVYAAAAALIFDLRSPHAPAVNRGAEGRRWCVVGETLPFARHLSGRGTLRRSVAADVLLNYHRLLTNTRA